MAPPRKTAASGRTRRRVRKNIAIGQAHIKTSFNNTIVALTDKDGNVIAWESAGSAGFKGSRKSTPFAAQVTADSCARKGMEHGLQKVEVFVKGPGSGRETAIRSLQAAGLEILGVKDVTPQAHNGVRPRKRRSASSGTRPFPEVQAVPPRRHEALPQGRALPDGEVRDRAPLVSAGRARPRPHQAVRVPAAAAREAEGAPLLRPAREAVPHLLREGVRKARASRARTCCGCSRRASTTSSTASASRPRARRRASSCGTATST